MITCPHCFRVVLPCADGECPSCGKNTGEGGDTTKQVFAVSASDALPSLCCQCCAPATRSSRVHRQRTVGGESFFAQVLVKAWFPAFFIVNKDEIAGREEAMAVELPLCEACEEPEPVHVGFEHQTISFVLAIAFAELVKASRSA